MSCKAITTPSNQRWYHGKMGVSVDAENVLHILPAGK